MNGIEAFVIVVMALVLAGLGAWLSHLRGRVAAASLATRAEMLEAELSVSQKALLTERDRLLAAEATAASLRSERDALEAQSRPLETLRATQEELQRENARLGAELQAERDRSASERALFEDARKKLGEAFRSVGAEALEESSKALVRLAEERFARHLDAQQAAQQRHKGAVDETMGPIRELLARQADAIQALERQRELAYTRLATQIDQVASAHQKLSSETGKLVSALATPAQRGRWGEMQLQRVVELAGMTKHCDFSTQVHLPGEEQALRPDLVVHLPGRKQIVVDAKVPLDAYLRMLDPDSDRASLLGDHVRQVRAHVSSLAGKEYWRSLGDSPELVVMFVPVESALSAAMEADPELHTDALRSRVLIATPTLLIALMWAVAYGWQQESIAENARQIAAAGAELHQRISKFLAHFEKLRKGILSAGKAYRSCLGSIERRVLPAARRLRNLGATTAPELTSPRDLELELEVTTTGARDGEAELRLGAE